MSIPASVVSEDNKFLPEVRKAFKLFSDTDQGITAPELARKMGCKLTRLYRYLRFLVLRGEAIPQIRYFEKHLITYYLLPKTNVVRHLEWPKQIKMYDDLVLDFAVKKKESGRWKAIDSEATYLSEMSTIKKALLSIGWQDGTQVSLDELHLLGSHLAKQGRTPEGIRTKISRIRALYGMDKAPRKYTPNRQYTPKPINPKEAVSNKPIKTQEVGQQAGSGDLNPGIIAVCKLAQIGYRFMVNGATIMAKYHGPGEPDPATVRPLFETVKRHKWETIDFLSIKIKELDEVKLPEPKPPHYGLIRRAYYGIGRSLKAIWRIIW